MISPTDVRMLQMLADVLHNRTPEKIPAEEWPALRKELQAQMVHALPGDHLLELGLNATVP